MEEEILEEVVEVSDYKEVVGQVLLSEANYYFDEQDEGKRTTYVKNICALMTQINEAEKIQNDRLKTQMEVDLKNQMNERDNQVKRDTIAEELKMRKHELIANKIESGAVLTANVVAKATDAAIVGGVLDGEFNGYETRSQGARMAIAMGKNIIKTRF